MFSLFYVLIIIPTSSLLHRNESIPKQKWYLHDIIKSGEIYPEFLNEMHGFEFVQGNNSDLFIVKDVEEKKNLVFKWFDKEEIIEDNIRPAFLNEKLISMIEEKNK